MALLIAPLVGISLLTAAVAVALNPVLVSVSLTGRRRKRSEMDLDDQLDPSVQQRVHEMKVSGFDSLGRGRSKDPRAEQ